MRETLQTTKLTNIRLHVSYNKDKPILLKQANMELGKKTSPASVPEVSQSHTRRGERNPVFPLSSCHAIHIFKMLTKIKKKVLENILSKGMKVKN